MHASSIIERTWRGLGIPRQKDARLGAAVRLGVERDEKTEAVRVASLLFESNTAKRPCT